MDFSKKKYPGSPTTTTRFHCLVGGNELTTVVLNMQGFIHHHPKGITFFLWLTSTAKVWSRILVNLVFPSSNKIHISLSIDVMYVYLNTNANSFDGCKKQTRTDQAIYIYIYTSSSLDNCLGSFLVKGFVSFDHSGDRNQCHSHRSVKIICMHVRNICCLIFHMVIQFNHCYMLLAQLTISPNT